MRIVCIFNTSNTAVSAVAFDESGPTAYDQVFDNWSDPEFLYDFFETNQRFLLNNHGLNVEQAVSITLEDAENLHDRLYKAAKDPSGRGLVELFTPLNNMQSYVEMYQPSKARLNRHSWVRLYAVRIHDGFYVITGGAIKLTQTMDEHSLTQEELQKLKRVSAFLQENGIETIRDIEN